MRITGGGPPRMFAPTLISLQTGFVQRGIGGPPGSLSAPMEAVALSVQEKRREGFDDDR